MNRDNREVLSQLVYYLSAKKTDDKVTKYIDTRIKTNRIVDDDNGDITYLDLNELNSVQVTGKNIITKPKNFSKVRTSSK
mgnify:CR=1 FL=1